MLRNVLLLALVSSLQASVVSAQTYEQQKAALDKVLEPQEQAKEETQKREAEVAAQSPPGDPFKWSRELTNLNAGGWEILAAYEDGEYVLLGTRRDALRTGNIATVWFRNEYRDTHFTNDRSQFKSYVERKQFDCVARTARVIAQVFYSENSLNGGTQSYTYPDNTTWTPVVPGTRGEDWINWACRVARSTHAQPAPKKPPPSE